MPPKDQDSSHPGTEPRSETRFPESSEDVSEEGQHFPVVGLGASAGGLEALQAFFAELPGESGAAYIVLVHVSPDHPSMMPELLQKVAFVPVEAATDGTLIEPDHAYVIPSSQEVGFFQGRIQLMERGEQRVALPIDSFFRALALDRGNRAVAVVLSGTGTDGTMGLKEVKAAEGLVLAQTPSTAKHEGMPQSALDTGLVDMALPPERIPERLLQYFRFSRVSPESESPDGQDLDWLNKIFALLRVKVGHDFSEYKQSSLLRRIHRRMGLNQLQDPQAYLLFLRENPEEQNALFRELLIGVTNFFRDPESFQALKRGALPGLFSRMQEGEVFRAWVPGCSTGEEVYSLAVILTEYMEGISRQHPIQIFGTDIDRYAVERAREGLYPSSIAADVGSERLERFFHQEGDKYRITKLLRDCVIFSEQDVLRDPPFSRLHLLLCRNLLIYLNARAQRQLLPLFHHTLVPGGILMLGSSETVGQFSNLFKLLDSPSKIYQRREVPVSLRQPVNFPTGYPDVKSSAAPSEQITRQSRNLEYLTQRSILERFAPPSVLVNKEGTILHIQGRTGKFLEPASGPPTQNILDMAREGLRIELSAALRHAVSSWQTVSRKGVQVVVNGATQWMNLYVTPLDQPRELAGNLLIAFEDQARELAKPPAPVPDEAESVEDWYKARIAELEEELRRTRESHQGTIEELESSNEELKSTNEELQSTNEELESSKEELQSLNEELQTVNAELQNKVDELSEALDDINNLLSSTEIAVIFTDRQLRIKRFSQQATRIINLIDSDVGRPLEHQSTNLEYEGLIDDLRRVLSQLQPVEREVRTRDGTWHMMRVMPYRSMDDRVQGVVATFRNVQLQKEAQEGLSELNTELEQAWSLVRSIFDMSPTPMAVLDERFRLVIANPELERILDLPGELDSEGKDFFGLSRAGLEDTDLRDRLRGALDEDRDFESTRFELGPTGERRSFTVQGEILPQKAGRSFRILLCFLEHEH